MKTHVLLTLFLWCTATVTYSQVGMTTNNPNKDAVLDLNNSDGTNTKGLLLPKVALIETTDPSPFSTHIAGMKVYNTNTFSWITPSAAVTPGVYYNDGTKWVREASSSSAWVLPGNTGTNATTNRVGTLDAVDFVTRTNNVERTRVNSSGQLMIGTPSVLTGGSGTKMMVNNGTTAGALQLRDGTQAAGKVLTSDANGLATWQTPVPDIFDEPTFGTTATAGAVIPASPDNVYYYTGSSVTLPPGKWAVSISALIGKTDGSWTAANEMWWIRSTFSNSPTTLTMSGDVTNVRQLSGLLPGNCLYSMITGIITINNTSTADKTYYYIAGNPYTSRTTGTVTFPKAGAGENRLVAERVNF
ncbi:hypothetical protein [Flavobacterium phragmitis]|uniref:Uncharacterized protein n=1 Tax=Flavobacterium phragmitis TaxID=739143 RepID=A0A1I1SDZ8_9FLAO|nr:hypothetical protein [Flavobacterium phragmitis]SFD44724.1 hypothetical protein SAMN05216297_1089 [Flavobacterium phragmitis]